VNAGGVNASGKPGAFAFRVVPDGHIGEFRLFHCENGLLSPDNKKNKRDAYMKTKTPNLTEMGVLNPEQIIGYATVHVSDDMDILKINYRRPKNSFLPKRRSYEFKRIGKPMPGSELRGEQAIRYEISPILARAVTELDSLLAGGKKMVATKQSLKHELASLSTEVNERIAHLTRMIEALD
jgi:hypothetical protein